MGLLGKNSRRFLACGVAYGALAGAGAVHAQTAGAQPAAGGNEVVVTANKRAEKLHDVAMGITAVTGEDLQTRQELDIQDFAAQVPGFVLNQINAGWNREILRGQNSGGAGATVATSIDDFPLSFSGSDSNASLTSTNPDTYDMQRIEVLKGPQGDLYGAAAEGGIVKYVTNAPNLSKYEGGIEAGIVNTDHGQTDGSIKGFVNVPLVDGKLALRMSAYNEGVPGYVSDPLFGRHITNSGYRQGGRVSILFKPTTDLTIRVSAFAQGLKDRDDNSVEVAGSVFDPSSTSTSQFKVANNGTYENNNGIGSRTKNVLTLYAADVEYDLHWAKLTSLTSYGVVKNSFINDYTNTPLAVDPVHHEITTYQQFLVGALGFPGNSAFIVHQIESVNKYNQEFRLSSDPGNQFLGHAVDWQLGTFFTREDVVFDQVFDEISLAPPYNYLNSPLVGPAGGAILPSRYEEAAVFGQLDYHFDSKFDVAFGFRNTYDTETSQIQVLCCVLEGPAGLLPRITNFEDAATWSVAPRYKLDDNTTFYARFASGHRPGGPNLLIPGAPADFPYNYHSDSTVNYEGGVRSYFFNKAVSVDLTAFYIDWTNIQILQSFVSSTNGQTFNVTGNAGSATSHGIEYDFSWKPIPGLTLGFLGAYTESYLTEAAKALRGGDGSDLSYIPKFRETLNADYDFNVAGDYDAFVGGTAVFTSSVFQDLGNYDGSHMKLPGYNTLALHGGFRHGPYSFELYAKNVTNTKGLLNYYYDGGYGGTGKAVFVTPLTVGARIAAKF